MLLGGLLRTRSNRKYGDFAASVFANEYLSKAEKRTMPLVAGPRS
jgi:hypothetical protein